MIAELTDKDYDVLKNLFMAVESHENTLSTHFLLMKNIKTKSDDLTTSKTVEEQLPDLIKIYLCIQLLTHLHGINLYTELDNTLNEIEHRIAEEKTK